ncbi:DoxX family protein (plasmid) [Pseudoalteromonas xiamenensis]|uniref:DoxX family protein n=1 Tax=Pseudoalteromonas xiamenensis TaxID=882626 RepID=UPI0027E3C872|nr:DoxX family protein [Pseudoalteromonas xiamenensis]WMN61843.1 DoxX family protein [Pseudoalteromonas xiamenensis]
MKLVTVISDNKTLSNIALLFARLSMAAIFLLAGLNKVQYYDGNAQYMASSGLPAELLPLVIVFEIGAALLIISGFMTQITAIALAGFSIVSALLFHFNLSDQMQFILFFKNVAMAGGFLALAATGAGRFSIDHKILSK